MFGTRQTGNVHTSVRQRPIKLLLLGLALVLVGILTAPVGIPIAAPGVWFCYVGGRQLARGIKVFFS